MKSIKIFSAILFIILAASCNRKMEFQHETFATLNSVSYNVNEDCGSVKIPVTIYNPTGAEVQIVVSTADGSGVAGTDYEIVSPASGIMTFSGETETIDIEVNIYAKTGQLTGSKTFDVKIASATPGFQMGAFNSASVTIIDLDHPLAGFIGTWSGTIAGRYQNPSYPTVINVRADEKDELYNTLIFDTGIDPFFFGMQLSTAEYEAVGVSNTEVAVIGGQPNGYSDCVLMGFNEDGSDNSIYFVLNQNGTMTLKSEYGVYTPSQGGSYEVYEAGAVFTKK